MIQPPTLLPQFDPRPFRTPKTRRPVVVALVAAIAVTAVLGLPTVSRADVDGTPYDGRVADVAIGTPLEVELAAVPRCHEDEVITFGIDNVTNNRVDFQCENFDDLVGEYLRERLQWDHGLEVLLSELKVVPDLELLLELLETR